MKKSHAHHITDMIAGIGALAIGCTVGAFAYLTDHPVEKQAKLPPQMDSRIVPQQDRVPTSVVARSFIADMQKDLGVKIALRQSTMNFNTKDPVLGLAAVKRIPAIAWDVASSAESQYIYDNLNGDPMNSTERMSGYKGRSVICQEFDLTWFCGDMKDGGPYEVRIMPLEVSDIDASARTFSVNVEGRKAKVAVALGAQIFARQPSDVPRTFADFEAAVQGMKAREANDPVMIEGGIGEAEFVANKLYWYQ